MLSFPSRLIRRAAVMAVMTTMFSVTLSALPPAGFAHQHERDNCGPDVNVLGAGAFNWLGPTSAHADSFDLEGEGDACGDLARKTTFVNHSDLPAEHVFRNSHSKRTEYSVEVGGGFKGAFEARMGYKSDKTATEEFESRVTVPPHTGAELNAAPSLHVLTGHWKHGWFERDTTKVEVARPTGHITWYLMDFPESENPGAA